MIKIQSKTIWVAGENVAITAVKAYSVNDNFTDSASIDYKLYDIPEEVTVYDEKPQDAADDWQPTPMGIRYPKMYQQGNLIISGDTYAGWDGSNEWIVNWILSELGFVKDDAPSS